MIRCHFGSQPGLRISKVNGTLHPRERWTDRIEPENWELPVSEANTEFVSPPLSQQGERVLAGWETMRRKEVEL